MKPTYTHLVPDYLSTALQRPTKIEGITVHQNPSHFRPNSQPTAVPNGICSNFFYIRYRSIDLIDIFEPLPRSELKMFCISKTFCIAKLVLVFVRRVPSEPVIVGYGDGSAVVFSSNGSPMSAH
jgi:hypothetical protein